MVRHIEIHEIDEFSEIRKIPNAAIDDEIISNVKNLEEENEMERFVREILYDPNKTSHGPMEIADILTYRVHVSGAKKSVAFVLKGKSAQKVSSKIITHQFAKPRQIPGLDLMVFGAVGDIQDDAQKDFVQCAKDAGCDYLIIDVRDWARLFIAYEKICPKDGTPYDETGTCKNNHVQDEGQSLEMEVKEKIRYSVIRQKDVSYGGAKRYSASILIDGHYTKDTIRNIIKEATKNLKKSNYYRSEITKARWEKTPAHVVWLFIACDLVDIQNANWLCRTCWIDPTLSENMRPIGLKGNDVMDDIVIEWNDDYKIWKEFHDKHRGTKEEVLERIQALLAEMVEFAHHDIELFTNYSKGNLSEEDFILEMQKMEPRVTELYRQSGNIPTPPPDCKDYDETCQNLFAIIHNMFLYYSQRGLKTWPKSNRDWLMQHDIKSFNEALDKVKFEGRKIH